MPVGTGVGAALDPVVGPGVGTRVGSLVRPGVRPTVATSGHTSLKHNIYSNKTLYYLASLTHRVGDSRVHRLLPNQRLYTLFTTDACADVVLLRIWVARSRKASS